MSLSIEEENHFEAIEFNSASVIGEVKQRISRYGFLIYFLINQLEDSCQNEVKKATALTQGSRRSAHKKPEALAFILKLLGISLVSIYQGLISFSHLLPPQKSKLINRIFSTRVECSTFIGMLLKPVYRLMESEVILKDSHDKLFDILCLAVVEFDEIQNVQSCLGQLLFYFEHIAEPLGDLLFILYYKYKNMGLYEEMIRYIISREFNPNDNKGPKAVALLIGKLVHLSPELVLKQFREICRLLDSKHYTLRSAIVEAAGIVLYDLCKNAVTLKTNSSTPEEEREQGLYSSNSDSDKNLLDIKSLFDLLEERVLDINPYTRIRAIQALTNLTELNTKFNKRRPRMTELAVQALQDKSSLVRRNALRLLSRLISTHPFNYLNEDGRLNLSHWEEKLQAVKLELEKLDSNSSIITSNEAAENSEFLNQSKDENTAEKTSLESSRISGSCSLENPINEISASPKLQLALTYHTEAVQFIKKVHEGLAVAVKLLNSKNKTETIESMDLFVLADAYGVETARFGVRLMIHLVWAKGGGNNDEALAIQKHLLSCYKSLFFDPPADVSPAEANNIVARSLISLTYGATISEAASLERLLSFAMEPSSLVASTQKASITQVKQDTIETDLSIAELANQAIPTTCMISDDVVKVLWKIYGYNQSMAKSQRRGAIIILGMLAKEKSSVINSVGLELLLRIGLGDLGRIDFKLARYSCIALQRMVNNSNNFRLKSSKKVPDPLNSEKKFCANHDVIRRLASFIILPSVSMEWFSLCEEAINAIYAICDAPDIVLSHLIRLKTKQVFSPKHPSLEIEHTELGLNYQNIIENSDGNSLLAQLLFIVGHTSLKTLVYLESLEGQFKRRKIESERERVEAMESKSSISSTGSKTSRKGMHQEEMTQEQEFNLIGGGTTEDDFSENLVYIRETELIFGQQSLLSRFGPLISTLCLEIIRDIQNQEYSEANAHWKRTAQVKLGVDSQFTQYSSLKRRHSKMLVVSATLSLIKMMCVSSEFCSNNLSILVTILEHTSKLIKPVIQSKCEIENDECNISLDSISKNNNGEDCSNNETIDFEEIDDYNTAAIVRSNIVLGMGDLAVQFNHELEDNMQFVYKRLRDHTKMVQRTTLLTLTFLILAGQVKAKDQQLLGQMARCLEDNDETIANLAHIFFLELAAKDNAIYNNFIDMFNSLVSYTKKSEEIAKREGDDPDDVEYSVSHTSIRVDNNTLRRSSRRSDINHSIAYQSYGKYMEDSMIDIDADEQIHNCNDAEDYESFEPLTKEALHRILKFLVSLVDKEKYIKQLSEKLAKRLEKCETPLMWDHLSYVLTLLPHKNEEISEMISAGFKKNASLVTEALLRDNLDFEDVYQQQTDFQVDNMIDDETQ